MNNPKHIGIVGVTAEGASLCYRTIVSEAAKILGEHKHPEISLNNTSFSNILEAQLRRDWESHWRVCRRTPEQLEEVRVILERRRPQSLGELRERVEKLGVK